MAIGLIMGLMAGTQIANSVVDGVRNSKNDDIRNEKLSNIRDEMISVEQVLDELGTKSVKMAETIQKEQQASFDAFDAKINALAGEGVGEYQEYLHQNGMNSTDDYISRQREISERQLVQQRDYQISSANETFKYESNRQQMENNQELLKVQNLINERGLKGSSIANQTISQVVSQETQKMNNIAMKFNTSYQDALYAHSQATQQLTAQLNTEEQSMKTNEFRGMLSWQASKRMEAFQDMTLNIQAHTTKFQRQMAELKYQQTIQQSKLNDLQTQAATA